MKTFSGLALAGLAFLGCALDARAAEIKVTIDPSCNVKVVPLNGTKLSKSKGDVLTWHFLNECRKEHKVFVCAKGTDALAECQGPPPAAIRAKFHLPPATTTTGTATTPTPAVAGCHVNYSLVPAANPLKYCVVVQPVEEPDVDCRSACATTTSSIRASELEINVEP